MRSSKKESIQQKFDKQETNLLQSKMWWVADNQNPFLIKFAISQNNALIMCTNLRELWVRKVTSQQLHKDKQIYAKGLNIKDIKNLLNLFQDIFSKADSDANYKFTENQDDSIDFKVEKKLTVYSLIWKFRLTKVKINIVDIVCKEILNPFSTALEVQIQRIQNFKKKLEAIEKDYIRKMTETQRRLYKSGLIQTQEEWKLFIPKIKERQLLNSFRLDKCSQFVIRQIATQKQQKKQQKGFQFVQQKGKLAIKRTIPQKKQSHITEDIDDSQFQAKLDKKRKKKQIDFI